MSRAWMLVYTLIIAGAILGAAWLLKPPAARWVLWADGYMLEEFSTLKECNMAKQKDYWSCAAAP